MPIVRGLLYCVFRIHVKSLYPYWQARVQTSFFALKPFHNDPRCVPHSLAAEKLPASEVGAHWKYFYQLAQTTELKSQKRFLPGAEHRPCKADTGAFAINWMSRDDPGQAIMILLPWTHHRIGQAPTNEGLGYLIVPMILCDIFMITREKPSALPCMIKVWWTL